MAQESRLRNFILGTSFLGGLFLIGLATLLVKGMPFTEAQTVSVRFPEVANLRTGEPVLIHGVNVGEVESIQYRREPEGATPVLVRCKIAGQVRLTDRTDFRVRSLGPLGGRYLEVIPGEGGEPKPPDWEGFRGSAEGDVFDQLSNLVEDTRSGPGLLGRLIRDEELASKAESTLDEFRSTFERINQQMAEGEGLLPRLIEDEELAGKFDSIADGVLSFLDNVNAEDGLMAGVQEIVDDVRSGKGIAGMIVSDEQAREDLEVTISELRKTAEDLGSGDGLARRLFTDEDLAEKTEALIDDLSAVAEKINQGEGTIAQFVNDPAVYDEILRLVVLARESVEDLREQAPISTFANVLFAAF